MVRTTWKTNSSDNITTRTTWKGFTGNKIKEVEKPIPVTAPITKSGAMVFEVGAGMTPEQTRVAQSKIAPIIPVQPRTTFKDVVKELPTGAVKVASTIGGFAKDIGQSIARNIASAGLSISKPSLKEIAEPLKSEDIQSYFGQGLFETMFGKDAEIKPIETRILEAEPKIKEWQKGLEDTLNNTSNLNTKEKLILKTFANLKAPQLAFVGVMGSIGLDLTPVGGLEKNAFKALVKVKTAGEAITLLRSFGVADDLARNFADDVIRVANDVDAEKLFKNIAELQQTTKAVPSVVKQLPIPEGLPQLPKLQGQVIPEKSIVKPIVEVSESSTPIISQPAKEVKVSNVKDVIRLDNIKNVRRQEITTEKALKNLNNNVTARVKEVTGIKEWKNATQTQLDEALDIMKKLEKDDKFLTPNQLEGLKDYTKTFDKDARLITKKELQLRFKETDEVMNGFATKYIPNSIIPTVDIKEHSNVIRKIVDEADFQLRSANIRIKNINQTLDDLLVKAEKSSTLKKDEVNKRIFQKMSGDNIKLSESEQNVAENLENYFKKVKDTFNLEKFRENYIPNIEKSFIEKFKARVINGDESLIDFIKSYKTKEGDIPLDIMLNLDNIIGNKKFFRFALERKGGTDVTTNIRKIIREYSQIAETKYALEKVLPEGQAAVNLLLQNKSATWLKEYLQNLKGRALDNGFRSGKGGWVAKTADTIIDFGYIRLLAGNVKSVLKNIVGGEVNSFVYQTFDKYMAGKSRILLQPKKSYKIITESGILDGSYVDYARAGFIPKAKRTADLVMYGGMEAAEYEIRGSILLGEMTGEEFAKGVLSKERFREILDKVAITQGIYTKVDSPLFVQTTLGRAVMQFGRWKITNTMLARRISIGAAKEWKTGVYLGKNSKSLIKMIGVYAAGTYLAYEAGKAGMKEARKIALASTELINTIINLPKEVIDAWRENPTLQNIDSVIFNYEQLMSYMGLMDEPRKIQFRSGVEDTYFSALNTLGVTGKDKETDNSIGLPALPKLPNLPSLPKL